MNLNDDKIKRQFNRFKEGLENDYYNTNDVFVIWLNKEINKLEAEEENE